MYAPQPQRVPAPLIVRLIGPLDRELIASFSALERELGEPRGALVLVDVRDLGVFGEVEMDELAETVAAARRAGRDIRLDARNLHWKRVAKKNLSGQPAVDAKLRSSVRRTIIVARSINRDR